MTNLSIVVNDGSPVRIVVDAPVWTVVQHFADLGTWSDLTAGTDVRGVPFGEDFPDNSLDSVRVDCVERADYTDRYVSCNVKRLNVS